jgi:hypothetical protein
MIQFNLLPDIKMQYIKAKRQEYMVILISTVATIAAVAILAVLIIVVDVVQKKQLTDVRQNVAEDVTKLKTTNNLNQILTVQNQLVALPALHNSKPAVSRLFNYLAQLTPSNATISKLDIAYGSATSGGPSEGSITSASTTTNTISISGSADSLATINQFADTLKFTSYSIQKQSNAVKPAFSNVVLSDFGDSSTQGATYTLTANFDPAIFGITNNVTLTVPGIINTRSEVAQPGVLFVQTGAT